MTGGSGVIPYRGPLIDRSSAPFWGRLRPVSLREARKVEFGGESKNREYFAFSRPEQGIRPSSSAWTTILSTQIQGLAAGCVWFPCFRWNRVISLAVTGSGVSRNRERRNVGTSVLDEQRWFWGFDDGADGRRGHAHPLRQEGPSHFAPLNTRTCSVQSSGTGPTMSWERVRPGGWLPARIALCRSGARKARRTRRRA